MYPITVVKSMSCASEIASVAAASAASVASVGVDRGVPTGCRYVGAVIPALRRSLRPAPGIQAPRGAPGVLTLAGECLTNVHVTSLLKRSSARSGILPLHRDADAGRCAEVCQSGTGGRDEVMLLILSTLAYRASASAILLVMRYCR